MGNVWGVLLGACILAWLNYKGLAVIGTAFNSAAGTSINVPNKSFLIFGIILVVMMLLRPEGLLPAARQKALIHEAARRGDGHGRRDGDGRRRHRPRQRARGRRACAGPFGGLVAVNDVDFTIPERSIVA